MFLCVLSSQCEHETHFRIISRVLEPFLRLFWKKIEWGGEFCVRSMRTISTSTAQKKLSEFQWKTFIFLMIYASRQQLSVETVDKDFESQVRQTTTTSKLQPKFFFLSWQRDKKVSKISAIKISMFFGFARALSIFLSHFGKSFILLTATVKLCSHSRLIA